VLHKLIFDTTSAATIADSHSVGAYLRASDGTLLTHTDVGGKKALDVRLAEGINVEVDLSHVDDSVKVGDGTDFLAINNDGSIVVTATDLDIRDLTQADEITVFQGTSPWVVSATDLDIRNLTFAADSVDVSGSSVSVSNTVTVSATDLDIRNLAHTQDSVKIGDGTDFLAVNADGSINATITGTITVGDAALANTAIATASNTLASANTAEDLVASPLANRKYLWAYNNGNRIAYIGASGVSARDGFPVPPGAYVQMRAGAAIDIEWVSALTGHDMRTMELS
jgi:hypothetical protein